jgi:two-component system NtrC family sensor kinase
VEATTLDKKHPKNLEINDALFQTQRLAGIGTLAASVAHELTNPISVITATCSNLQLLAAENDLKSQDLDRYLDMINQSAWRCVRLIEMLRNYSHIDGPEVTRSKLNQIIKDSLTLVSYQFEREYNISIVTNLSPDIPSIYCDRNQITQVFINLLTNARDALPERGGKIWIQSHYDPEKRRGMVMVRDNGSGIEPVILDRIFEPFFTTKAPGKGTGLGLAIASQIVNQHQGDISVETGANAGTTFIVELPIEKRDREQPGSF